MKPSVEYLVGGSGRLWRVWRLENNHMRAVGDFHTKRAANRRARKLTKMQAGKL